MPVRNIIGILTPYTGGFYYGAVLSGILEAATERGCTAVAFEMTRVRMRCSAGQMLAGQRIDGWLAVNEFDDPALVQELERRGQPVVHLHSRPQNGTGGCAVLPDNQGGTGEATEHLLNHGHTRIAFAGSQKQGEIGERFEGYKATLEKRGIALDESMVFHTASNQESGGETLGHQLLALDGPLPFTALVAGTDRLALGMMAVLNKANKVLPQELAVVAFDDIDSAQFTEPSLTTVKQSFRALAGTATHLLLDIIQKQVVPPPEVRVPTKLVVRRSCGCVATHSLPPQVSCTAHTRADKLAIELLKLAGFRRGRETTPSDWPGAKRIAQTLDAAVAGTLNLTARPSIEWWVPFLEYIRDAESLVRVMALLEATARNWCGDDLVNHPDATGALRNLRVSLLHAWQRSERQAVQHYESVTQATYRITSALNSLHSDPARDLSWLQWSLVKYACVALWEGASSRAPVPSRASEPALSIVGRYARTGEPALHEGDDRLVPADFPPIELIEVARRTKTMLTVAGIPRAGDREYGVLAACYPLDYEQLDYAGSPGDWALQIGTALDKAVAETQLRRTAEIDALTGLPNRFTLIQHLERLRSLEGEQTFALLYVDVDDFKKVNDSLGHEAGDGLLVQLSDRLRAVTQTHAPEGAHTFMARLGGDEFVVVLMDTEAERTAIAFAEFIQQALQKPFSLGQDKIFVSGSIGISFGKGSSHLSQELLRDADTAMYRAKIQGRARYEVFHRDMHAQAVEKLQLDARLRQALELDELELWYQPILSLRTGRVISAEALIRWRHPEQGLLGPGRFLAVAEDVGLAIPISEWVIKTACRNAAAWQAAHPSSISVHVNVPAAHVQQPGFVEFVEAALNAANLSPHAFGVEIVESTVMDDHDVSVHALSRLLALGVHVAIDDFGTGYSNLSYLRNFPISSLKVDQSFVRTLPGRTQDSAIVKAIIAMGQGLGLSVVAEGIETLEQLQFLIQSGCDQGQGYYFAKPMDPKTAHAQLPLIRIHADHLIPSSGRSHSSRAPSFS